MKYLEGLIGIGTRRLEIMNIVTKAWINPKP